MKTNQKVILHQYGLILLMLFVLGVIMTSCSKDEASSQEELPELTSEGKNTFGCLVNGEVWVAHMPFAVGGAIALEGTFYQDIGALHLTANRKLDAPSVSDRVDLVLLDMYSEGEYQIPTYENQMRGFTDYLSNHNCSIYNYNDSLLRRVIITHFSSSQGIISGTFEMDLVNPSCPGDTIRIREGRFDWRY